MFCMFCQVDMQDSTTCTDNASGITALEQRTTSKELEEPNDA